MKKLTGDYWTDRAIRIRKIENKITEVCKKYEENPSWENEQIRDAEIEKQNAKLQKITGVKS